MFVVCGRWLCVLLVVGCCLLSLLVCWLLLVVGRLLLLFGVVCGALLCVLFVVCCRSWLVVCYGLSLCGVGRCFGLLMLFCNCCL